MSPFTAPGFCSELTGQTEYTHAGRARMLSTATGFAGHSRPTCYFITHPNLVSNGLGISSRIFPGMTSYIWRCANHAGPSMSRMPTHWTIKLARAAKSRDTAIEPRSGLNNIDGREAAFAGWAARSEERGVVVPLKRRATKQTACKGASRLGFAPLARLHCCAPGQ